MRTTIDMPDALMAEVKETALARGMTLRQFFEAALRLSLSKTGKRSDSFELNWNTEKGTILPGVVLEDRDVLLELMDERS